MNPIPRWVWITAFGALVLLYLLAWLPLIMLIALAQR